MKYLQQKQDANNAKTQLEAYCRQKGYDPPEYVSTFLPKFNKFEGKVCIEGVTYSTSPLDYSNVAQADIEAASVALKNIKEFTVSLESDEQLSRKIYDCITDNGIFLKYVPNIFE